MRITTRSSGSLATILAVLLGSSATTFAQSVDADPQLSWADFPGQLAGPARGAQSSADAGKSPRPHAPWIFRCTLDGNPRTVVLALAPDLWVAYDAEAVRFDMAWRGGVRLDGSVYTGAHGPNPSITGDRLLRGPEVQFALLGGATEDVTPRWLGYRIEEGRAVLMSEVRVGDATLLVEERPEAVLRDGRLLFERRFDVVGALPGRTLAVRVPEEWTDGRPAPIVVTGGTAVGGLVSLEPGRTTSIETQLPPTSAAAEGGAR